MANPGGDTAIYARQGFAHRTGIGAAPALVVVDFVLGFVDPEKFGGGSIGLAIGPTTGLLALAREKAWSIAHTRIVYAGDGSDCGAFVRKVPPLAGLTEDSPLSQIVPELAPQPGELVIRKRQASAFFDTGLAGWLTFRRIDTVIVAGCTTSGCVRATVVDACSHDFRTIVVTDCVGDRAEAPHMANLFDMGQKYADLMSLAELQDATR